MATDKKISELEELSASSIRNEDLLVLVHDNKNYKVTVSSLLLLDTEDFGYANVKFTDGTIEKIPFTFAAPSVETLSGDDTSGYLTLKLPSGKLASSCFVHAKFENINMRLGDMRASLFDGFGGIRIDGLNSIDTVELLDMSMMFYFCENLKTLDLRSFDTTYVETMDDMFHHCTALETINLSSFETANVSSMRQMFYGCSSLAELDLRTFDTSNVLNMFKMFNLCESLTTLKLGVFDMSNCLMQGALEYMFADCTSLANVSGTIKGLSRSLSLSDCPLTKESAMVFINGLANVSSTQSLAFKQSTFETLLEAEIAIATNKGWSVIGE